VEVEYRVERGSGVVAGTYLYHSHVAGQRTDGTYGILVMMERKLSPALFDVDYVRNTLVLQELHRDISDITPLSILINGKGRVGSTINAVPPGLDSMDFLRRYAMSKIPTTFVQIPNLGPEHLIEIHPVLAKRPAQ
jgi:FtsP/CotA-like multicopper oxidase with cupredoxin domain